MRERKYFVKRLLYFATRMNVYEHNITLKYNFAGNFHNSKQYIESRNKLGGEQGFETNKFSVLNS